MAQTLRIKKGDQVMVISGDDGPHGGRPGKRGRVLQVLSDRERVIVEGVNIVVKHRRAGRRGQTPQQLQSGRIEMPAAIPRSRVMVVCPRCDRPTRVHIRIGDSGERSRICKRCDEIIDQM